MTLTHDIFQRTMQVKANSEYRVFYNGKVYTADETLPYATAFVLKGNRFYCVGEDSEALEYGSGTDLKGRRVVPGLIESHAHMIGNAVTGGMNLFFIDPKTAPGDLPGALSEVRRRKEYADASVLTGMGIRLTEGTFSAADIDSAVPDKPVFLFSDDGHALLMNKKALALAGVSAETPDPGKGSYFVRDQRGEPTGLAVEIAAMQFCLPACRHSDPGDLARKLDSAGREYARFGFTAGFDAATVTDGDPEILDFLKEYEASGRLHMRLFTSFVYYGEDQIPIAELLEGMKLARDSCSSELIHPTTLKMIADGTVENLSALMYEPYCVENGTCCTETFRTETMSAAARKAAEAGFNVHIHAIGDRAIDQAIEALSGIDRRNVTGTIAHNEVYTKQSIEKMTSPGNNIFFQTTPYWFVQDEHTERILGRKRMKYLFPAGSMARGGVKVTFGSDSLDGEICRNPFAGMFFAAVRGLPGQRICFPPESEGITMEEALKAYTINGAMQLGAADFTGSISPGKYADFVILDRDILQIPIRDVIHTMVDATYFNGVCVYERKPENKKAFLDGGAEEKAADYARRAPG
jgi:predicted amidohydrolase YtcJ